MKPECLLAHLFTLRVAFLKRCHAWVYVSHDVRRIDKAFRLGTGGCTYSCGASLVWEFEFRLKTDRLR